MYGAIFTYCFVVICPIKATIWDVLGRFKPDLNGIERLVNRSDNKLGQT